MAEIFVTSLTERLFGEAAEKVILFEQELLSDTIVERVAGTRPMEDPDNNLRFELHYDLGILISYHYQISREFPSPPEIARHGVRMGLEFFFGPWRDEYEYSPGKRWNREDCRRELGWYDVYRESLCLSLLLGELASAEKLSAYPGPDAYQCDVEATPAQHEYYLLLAAILRRDSQEALGDAWKPIKSTRSRRIKPLVDALEAIERRDAAAAVKALKSHCAYYRKHRDDIRPFYAVISLDASILWNLAAQRGLALDGLTVDEQDVILTPASCGLVNDGPIGA